MKIKHIVSCFFVSLIGLSACSIEELPYNQLTEDELDGSYESLLSATRGNYAVFKQTAFHQGWHYAGELASDNVSLSGVSSDALMYIYNYQRITDNYHMSNMWGWAYRSIINSNKILEKAQEGESKEMDQLIGENYFLRGWLEFVLVNDCSPDGGKTIQVLRKMAAEHRDVKVIDLARNSGQHNALMAALRHADGDVIIGMDDDGQTHPSQLGKLFETFDQGYDLVYGYYPEKKHNWFRNLGSKFNDLTINMMINKPKDVRTSSYFLVRKFVRDYAIQYKGSYTYLLGLFMRCTQNIASVPIRHFEREVGESGYTLGQLIRLWSSVLGFSVIPLRMASIAGFFFAGVGFIMAIVVFLMKFMRPDMSMGWPSLMCAITFFFGLNFMFLGMIGEYLGRMFLGMNREPQYVIKAMYNVSASTECDVDIDREVNRGEEIF